MALIIEDGSNVPNANSYITAQEWLDWAAARGIQHAHSQSDVEAHILRGMDYFEAQSFIGLKANSEQSLQWPRDWVIIDGYSVESNTIPPEVKNSCYEVTNTEAQGNSYISAQGRVTTSESVGSISVSYASGQGSRNTTPAVTYALAKIVIGTNSVTRA
mgnify:CR=1 FL=1